MKNTKRALLMSALSLLLCVSMLVGTTFAWFTDSVSSGQNIIQSGNLDVELEYYDDDAAAWKTVNEDTEVFGYNLWEPGYTKKVLFRVINKGSLALKYDLTADVYEETPGINKAGETFKLSDSLYTASVAADADRDTILAAEGVKMNSSLAVGSSDLLAAGATSEEFALAIWMPTTVGNEANHNGTNVPAITFGINLLATQAMKEEDSFGKDYDKNAVYADAFVDTATDLQSAIDDAENGDVIALTGDIDLNDLTGSAMSAAKSFALSVAKGKSVTIDLAGYNMVGVTSNDSGNQGAFQVKGDLAIRGGGTIAIEHTGANMGWNNLSAVVSVEGGTLTVGEGVALVHKGGTDMAYAVDVNTTLGATTLNVNGAVLSSSYIGVRIFNNHKTGKGIVNLNSGIVNGDKNGYDIWAQLMGCPAENAVVNIADGIEYTTADMSGTMYYVDAATVTNNATALKEAVKGGEDVVLTDDVNAPLTEGTIYGTPAAVVQKNGGVIDGNGNALIIENPVYNGYAIETYGGTIKNLIIDSEVGRGIIISSPKSDVVIDNVVVDGPGYAVNTTEHNGKNLTINNSTINGWTSLAGLDSVAFNKCNLGENTKKYWQNMGYDQDYDRLVRPYVTTTFTDCKFEKGYYIDLSALGSGETVTLKNCTCDGVVLTAENYADYITIENYGSYVTFA